MSGERGCLRWSVKKAIQELRLATGAGTLLTFLSRQGQTTNSCVVQNIDKLVTVALSASPWMQA